MTDNDTRYPGCSSDGLAISDTAHAVGPGPTRYIPGRGVVSDPYPVVNDTAHAEWTDGATWNESSLAPEDDWADADQYYGTGDDSGPGDADLLD